MHASESLEIEEKLKDVLCCLSPSSNNDSFFYFDVPPSSFQSHTTEIFLPIVLIFSSNMTYFIV